MERISIFNYEAFYLDFLEGNLNEVDTLLLKNFLTLNPDLDVEIDELLPEFKEDEVVLDNISKLMLKSDFEGVEIDEVNVNYFIVAETEGLLSKKKVVELDQFVRHNTIWQAERKLAKSIVLSADENVVYSDKKGLKQKRKVVVLWPYASAIAAASIVFFFYWVLTSPSEIETIPVKQKAGIKIQENQPQKDIPSIIEKTEVIPTANNTSSYPKEATPSNIKKVKEERDLKKSNDLISSNVDKMQKREIGPIAYANNHELVPINKIEKQKNAHHPNNGADLLKPSYYAGMHNPIELLTKFVTKKTNTEVDFKTTEKVEDERRGFYIKIGKFEISRSRRH